MSKEIWIQMHERLIAEYMDKHPEVDWNTAAERTESDVDKYVADWYADQIDYWRMRAKEGLK